MTIPYTLTRLLSASALAAALSGFAIPALALDADDFATKTAAAVQQGAGKLTFASIDADGDRIVLKSARLEPVGQDAFGIGDITFTGVEEGDDGSYLVDLVEFEDVVISEGANKLSVLGIEMDDLVIPGETGTDTLAGFIRMDSMSTGEIRAEDNGEKVFSMSGLALKLEYSDDALSQKAEFTGSDIWLDLSKIDDPKARQAVSELGYDTLTGDFRMAGGWEAETGVMDLSEYSLTLDDVGSLFLSLQISGYTLELVEAMQQAQKAAADNPDKKAAEQALGLSMLGLMQQLSFNSATVRFEDASVTERALTFAGKQQGVSGDQMRMALKGMLPLMLGRIGIPELQKQIAAAASVYLDNPQDITITANPASPVALPVIMGAGMGDPKSLVGLLNVQISANQPVEICCKQ